MVIYFYCANLALVSVITIKNAYLDTAENLGWQSMEKNNKRGIVLRWKMGKEKKGERERASQAPSKKTHYIISFVWFAKIENMCLTNLTANFFVHRNDLFLKFWHSPWAFSWRSDIFFHNYACKHYWIFSGYSSTGSIETAG